MLADVLENKFETQTILGTKQIVEASSKTPWENSPPLSRVGRQLFPAPSSLKGAQISSGGYAERGAFYRRREARLALASPTNAKPTAVLDTTARSVGQIRVHDNGGQYI